MLLEHELFNISLVECQMVTTMDMSSSSYVYYLWLKYKLRCLSSWAWVQAQMVTTLNSSSSSYIDIWLKFKLRCLSSWAWVQAQMITTMDSNSTSDCYQHTKLRMMFLKNLRSSAWNKVYHFNEDDGNFNPINYSKWFHGMFADSDVSSSESEVERQNPIYYLDWHPVKPCEQYSPRKPRVR